MGTWHRAWTILQIMGTGEWRSPAAAHTPLQDAVTRTCHGLFLIWSTAARNVS